MGGDVDADVNVDVNMPANMVVDADAGFKIDPTSKLTTDSTLAIAPTSKLTTDSSLSSDSSIELKPLSMRLTLDPVQTQSAIDLEPVVVDLCTKVVLGPLPATCIRMPYEHHFGVSMFGVEVMGFHFRGEQHVVIEPHTKRAEVAWGGEGGGTPDGAPSQGRARPVKLRPGSTEAAPVRISIDD